MAQSEFSWPLINDNVSQADKQALINFLQIPDVRLTNGPRVREFERQWSEWLGVEHTTFVNSGASGNYIMMSVVREIVGTGEVIVPPIGWVSDIAPAVNLGFTPVFVDVDKSNFSITFENIKNAVTPKTKAIVLVHAMGFSAMSDELLDFVRENDILLIEDCCESHGAIHNGKKIGTFGDMSSFSFYFGHHITTIEGGVVCTNNSVISEYLRLFRSHGMTREASKEFQQKYQQKYPDLNPLFTFAVPGYNMRNMEINAVLGIEQMKRLDDNIECRIDNFNCWIKNLDSERFHTSYKSEGSSNFALPLVLNEKDKGLLDRVCRFLEKAGVEYRLGTAGGGNQARQPYLTEGRYHFRVHGGLEMADHIHEYGLYIGNHTELTRQQIINLCEGINNV